MVTMVDPRDPADGDHHLSSVSLLTLISIE